MNFSISWIIGYFVEEALDVMSILGPTGVFLLMVMEGIGIPFPSELIMPFAGFLSQGNLGLFVVFALAGSIGGFVGNLILYYISVYLGRPVILYIGKFVGLTEEHLVRTESWFEKRGEWTVFFGRFVPGFRSFMSIPPGIAKMNVLKFSLFTLAGSLIWSTGLEAAGYVVGSKWNELSPTLYRIGDILLIIFVVFFVTYFLYLYYKRRRKTPVNTEEQT